MENIKNNNTNKRKNENTTNKVSDNEIDNNFNNRNIEEKKKSENNKTETKINSNNNSNNSSKELKNYSIESNSSNNKTLTITQNNTSNNSNSESKEDSESKEITYYNSSKSLETLNELLNKHLKEQQTAFIFFCIKKEKMTNNDLHTKHLFRIIDNTEVIGERITSSNEPAFSSFENLIKTGNVCSIYKENEKKIDTYIIFNIFNPNKIKDRDDKENENYKIIWTNWDTITAATKKIDTAISRLTPRIKKDNIKQLNTRTDSKTKQEKITNDILNKKTDGPTVLFLGDDHNLKQKKNTTLGDRKIIHKNKTQNIKNDNYNLNIANDLAKKANPYTPVIDKLKKAKYLIEEDFFKVIKILDCNNNSAFVLFEYIRIKTHSFVNTLCNLSATNKDLPFLEILKEEILFGFFKMLYELYPSAKKEAEKLDITLDVPEFSSKSEWPQRFESLKEELDGLQEKKLKKKNKKLEKPKNEHSSEKINIINENDTKDSENLENTILIKTKSKDNTIIINNKKDENKKEIITDEDVLNQPIKNITIDDENKNTENSEINNNDLLKKVSNKEKKELNKLKKNLEKGKEFVEKFKEEKKKEENMTIDERIKNMKNVYELINDASYKELIEIHNFEQDDIFQYIFGLQENDRKISYKEVLKFASKIATYLSKIGLSKCANELTEEVKNRQHEAHESNDGGQKLPTHYLDILRSCFIIFGLYPRKNWTAKTSEDFDAMMKYESRVFYYSLLKPNNNKE